MQCNGKVQHGIVASQVTGAASRDVASIIKHSTVPSKTARLRDSEAAMIFHAVPNPINSSRAQRAQGRLGCIQKLRSDAQLNLLNELVTA